jgi:TetR/AcrR family transcriptional repressor of mexJK operon
MATTDAARRRGRPPGSEGRELLAIAREQFLRQGFRGTTMDAIAARARISKHTLYAAYPSKNTLFTAVVRDWVDQGHDALAPPTQALAQTSDPRAGLRELAAVLQAGILSPPVLQMRAMIAAEADALPEVAADYMQRSWNRNLARLAEALGTLDRRGLLAIDDAATAAEQFVWLTIAAPLTASPCKAKPDATATASSSTPSAKRSPPSSAATGDMIEISQMACRVYPAAARSTR